MKTIFKLLLASCIALSIGAQLPIKKTVVLDVGHGGKDLGATLNGLNEKDLLLEIATQVQKLAQTSDIEVVLTRKEDVDLSLADRVAMVKRVNPSAVVSIHLNNSKNASLHGVEIFTNEHIESQQLANAFNTSLPVALQKSEAKPAKHYLLKNIKQPAVLVELAYLSNKKDLAYVQSTEGKTEIAQGILKALQ